MMNLGLGQKVEGSQETGSENNKEREVRMEGKGWPMPLAMITMRKSIHGFPFPKKY